MPDGAPIRTAPLFWGGLLYVPNNAGKLYVVDVNRTGTNDLAIYQTFNLGTLGQSDVSLDVSSFRIYVATAGGRLYSISLFNDPTPGSP